MQNDAFRPSPSDRETTLVACATILGFVGMLRPHTFSQLKLSSFQLIKRNRGRVPVVGVANYLKQHGGSDLCGFLITFKSKTMSVARAYFPNLSMPCSYYARMCPVRAIVSLAQVGLFDDKSLKLMGRRGKLRKFLLKLTSTEKPVALYALRIGGRTWNISQGLDRQFVDYLGTWKSPEASVRYYCEEPAAVLRKLRKFYDNLPDPTNL